MKFYRISDDLPEVTALVAKARPEMVAEIIVLADEMREAQRDYFKHQTRARLDKSKALERLLDHALAELKTPGAVLRDT